MTDEVLKKQIASALGVAREAANLGGQVLGQYWGRLSDVQTKDKAGLVTEADLHSEKVIVEYLQQNFTDSSILAEEDSHLNQSLLYDSDKDWCWIIDPLDGTTNYVFQFPIFVVSIGLSYKGQMVVGVIHAPVMKQTFCAAEQMGAFCNDKPIAVSQRGKIAESLLATGFSVHRPEVLAQQLQLFSSVIRSSGGVRRAGAAAYDLAMVASGVFDGYWESMLSPWDTAAGCLLVKEAGGQVTTYSGQPYAPHDKTIVASNGLLHNSLLEQIQRYDWASDS